MNKQSTLVVVVLTLIASLPSLAEDKPSDVPAPANRYAAFMVGPALVTSSGGGSGFSYAGNLGVNVSQDSTGKLGLGVYFASLSNSATVSGITVNGNTFGLMAELITHEAFGTGLYLGARAGLGMSSATVTASGVSIPGSGSSFAFEPVLGYDFELAKQVRLVLDASWYNQLGTTMTFSTGSSIALSSSAAVLLHAGLGLHF